MNTDKLSSELAELVELAKLAARASAGVILPHFRSGLDVQSKADGSPVTIADKNAEQCILDLIREHRPNDGWLGEEFGSEEGSSGYRWTIDPIDGTLAFVHGVPLFGTLLAVQKNEQTLVGLINMPALDEMVIGVSGAGTFYNGQPCRVSQTADISQATIVSSSFTTLLEYNRDQGFDSLVRQAKEARTWGDCYGYLLVATGRAEIMVDPILSPWDIAPMGPIITEAGGKLTGLDGGEGFPMAHALASNGLLHSQGLAAFAK
jgi:histidinol phosphatase-like enzyme (inositol monophosphatase family)